MGLLKTDEAAEYLGVSKSWLDHKRTQGEGPQAVRINRKVLYRVADLDAFIEQHLEPTK